LPRERSHVYVNGLEVREDAGPEAWLRRIARFIPGSRPEPVGRGVDLHILYNVFIMRPYVVTTFGTWIPDLCIITEWDPHLRRLEMGQFD
jgi:hypothetical protein